MITWYGACELLRGQSLLRFQRFAPVSHASACPKGGHLAKSLKNFDTALFLVHSPAASSCNANSVAKGPNHCVNSAH